MLVRVLGSAAGGGVPQWNCACANCAAARRGERPRRSQSSFAVSGDGETWWLVNVSPDVAQQIETFAPLQPRSTRGTPIAGFLVTDANVDHLGGLAVLRQDGDHRFDVYSSATIRRVASSQPAFAPFAHAPHAWHALAMETTHELAGGLRVRAFAVPGLTPGYDGRRALPEAVVAYEIEDPARRTRALFAPVFAALAEPIHDALARVDLAFLDGSFWSDDELAGLGVPKPAQSLGHLPVGGPDGSLAAIAARPPRARVGYAHLNNSSPLLDPASPETAAVTRARAFVAADDMHFSLEPAPAHR